MQSSSTRRIPEGTITGEISLEACKAYPTKLFEGLQIQPRIAYADFNTHQEHNILSVKLLPDGGKTAPHPQIVFFVNGSYHVENLGYFKSDPLLWTTWLELHFDAKELKKIIDALIKAEMWMEGFKI